MSDERQEGRATTRWVRILAMLEDAGAWLSTAVLTALMLLICVDVLLRYVFNAPLSWGVEISEISLLWITMLGSAYVLREGGHIRVDLLFNMISPAATRRCAMFSCVICAIACAVLTVFGSEAVLTSIMRGSFRPTQLEVPVWAIIIVIPVGAALLTLRFVRLFFEYRSGSRRIEDESMA